MRKDIINQCENYDFSGKKYLDKFTYQDIDGYIALDYLYLFYGLSHNGDITVWNKFAIYAKQRATSEKSISVKMKYQYIYNQFLRITEKYREIDM